MKFAFMEEADGSALIRFEIDDTVILVVLALIMLVVSVL